MQKSKMTLCEFKSWVKLINNEYLLNTHKIVYELLTFVIGRCKLEETYMRLHLLATIGPIAADALLLG